MARSLLWAHISRPFGRLTKLLRPLGAARLFFLALSLLSLPFFYIVDGVRNSTPSIDSTVATQAGWVTIAYSQADFHASTFLRMRIVYDPAYHLNATPGAKNWLDAKHRSPDWVGLNRLASNLENHGAAYVVLICKAPLHGDFSPVHFSLFLEGPAKLHLPAQISWEDGEPLIQSAFPRGVRGKFRGSSELQDVQAFDFTVNAAPPCQATRKLAEGPTLLERTGDDVESGFAVAGFDAKDLPQFSRATFAGIPGPRSSLTTPLVGGTPDSNAPSPQMSVYAFFEEVGRNDSTWVMGNLPSELTMRKVPAGLRFDGSSPTSNSATFPDLISVSRADARWRFVVESSEVLWNRVGSIANIYLGVGAGVVGTMLWEYFRRTRDQQSGAVGFSSGSGGAGTIQQNPKRGSPKTRTKRQSGRGKSRGKNRRR